MDNLKAIDLRTSRRTYLPTPIDVAKIDKIKTIITDLNLQSGLNITYLPDGSKAFTVGKSYGFFKGVKALIILKGDKNLENLKEKSGYFGEILVLEATKMGLGTCWVAGTYDKSSALLGAADNEEIICVLTIGNVEEENSFKERFIRGIVRKNVKSIDAMCTVDIPMPDWFKAGMEAVQKAPTAKNSQKVSFSLKDQVVTASVPNDYPMDLIDLGICKLHFEVGSGKKFEMGNHGRLK